MEHRSSLVANVSRWFIDHWRMTFLILVGILVLGFLSYTQFLNREGFPAVEVPIAVIQAPYFVDDINAVNEDVTEEIERAIAEHVEILEVRSVTTENRSRIVVEFEQDYSATKGVLELERLVDKNAHLPDEVEPEYITFDASTIDGDHHINFSLTGEKTPEEMEEIAEEVAKELATLPEVQEANPLYLFEDQTNPITGATITEEVRFHRVGFAKNGEIEFENGISIGLIRPDDVGSIELSDAARAEIERLQDDGILDDIEVSWGGDLTSALQDQIDDLESNAFYGLIAVIAILLLFVNWRASLVGAIFMPVVMAGTFAGLYMIGYSLNVITLFALILVLGLLVDDATVVVEAIDHYRQKGLKGKDAIIEAIRDIGIPDISGSVTTILAFTPMLFISGVLGEFIRLMPVTVILALVISVVVALTIVPFLSSILYIGGKKKSLLGGVIGGAFSGFGIELTKLGGKIGQAIAWILHKPWFAGLVLLVGVGSVAIGGVYASKLDFSIFPPAKDTEAIFVELLYPPGTELEEALAISRQAEIIISEEAGNHAEGLHYFVADKWSSWMYLELSPMESRKTTSREIREDLEEAFEDEIDNFGETTVKVTEDNPGPPTSDFQFIMQVYGTDNVVLEEATEEFVDYLDGKKLGDGEKVIEVQIANLEYITKIDGRSYAEVRAKVSDPTNTQLALDIKEDIEAEYDIDALADLGLAEDALGFDFGEDSDNLASFESAGFALIIAVMAIYAVLVLQFNSFSQPMLILLAIPLSFSGLFAGLYYTDNALSFFVMLGITALAGIVVNNTILLVDYANNEQKKGASAPDAIAEAVSVRFRPLLTTSATTIVALIPLALTDPFWEPLTYSIIFGLIASTILVIFVFPVYYGVIEIARGYRGRIIESLRKIEFDVRIKK